MEKMNAIGLLTASKPTKKLCDLPVDTTQPIYEFKLVNTKFGKKLLVVLEEFQVYLPARFAVMIESDVVELNKSCPTVGLVYRGKKECSKDRMAHCAEFVHTTT